MSKLLINNTDIGKEIMFSRGASSIHNVINNINEDALIYFDLVPDNEKSIEQLRIQIDCIESVFKYRAYIIPIICIEYFVVKFINKYVKNREIKGTDLNKLLLENSDFDYDLLYALNKNDLSIEKRYKSLLYDITKSHCLVNKQSNEDKRYFYRYNCKDCSCYSTDCYGFELFDLKSKANLIYSALPAIISNSCNEEIINTFGLDFNRIKYKKVIEIVRHFYKEVSIRLNLDAKYFVDIDNLLDKCILLSEI